MKYLLTLSMWSGAFLLLLVVERLSTQHYQWDRHMLFLAHGYRSFCSDRFFAFVTWAGSLFTLVPVTILICGLLVRNSRPTESCFLGLSLAGVALFSRLAKLWFARPRPDLFPIIGEIPVDASYPSAHTTQIVAFAVALCWILKPEKLCLSYFLVSCIFLLLVAAVGYSRIHLQVHFPSDVLGGALLGLLWVLGLAHLLANINIIK